MLVKHWSYMAMLIFTVCGSFWLEVVLKVRVLARMKRLLMSLAPVGIFFLAWDAYAIKNHHWTIDPHQTLDIYGPFHIPLEEFLFFLIVPIAAIMTIEGVRSVKTHWLVGDEKFIENDSQK